MREECHELLRHARQEISALTGLKQICPDSLEWPKGQMAAIPLLPCDADELKRRLASRDDYRVEVPIMEWGGRRFALWGVSVQGYNNTTEDVEALVNALAALRPFHR